jgi:hypothetical protein
LDEEKVEEADQYAALPSFRSRILPVLGTIPALFGNAMASFVITELAGFKTEPLAVKGTRKTFEKLFKELCNSEKTTYGDDFLVYLNADDLGFIFEETWRSRSALSKAVNQKLVLVRWDPTKEANFGNMICLTKQEANKHQLLQPHEFTSFYGEEFVDFVQERFNREAASLKLYRAI